MDKAIKILLILLPLFILGLLSTCNDDPPVKADKTPDQILTEIYTQGNSELGTLNPSLTISETVEDGYINIAENESGIPVTLTGMIGATYALTCTNCMVQENTSGTMTEESMEFHIQVDDSLEIIPVSITISATLSDKIGYETDPISRELTVDITPPKLIIASTTPADTSFIQANTQLVYTFTEGINSESYDILDNSSTSILETLTPTWSNNSGSESDPDATLYDKLTLVPKTSWNSGAVHITLQVTDKASNPLTSNAFTYYLTGTSNWGNTITSGTDSSEYLSVAYSDSDDSSIAAGYINGTGTFSFKSDDSVTASGNAATNAVLVKYTAEGVPSWAKSVSTAGTGTSEYSDVALDSSGAIYVVGTFGDTTAFDFGDSITSTPAWTGTNIILLKYNASGTAQWAKTTVAAPQNAGLNAITLDSSGNIYVAGYINGITMFDFGDGVTTAGSFGNKNILVAKYNSSGMAQWAKTTSDGSGDTELSDIAVDESGNVYVVGYISGNSSFELENSKTVTGPYSALNGVIACYSAADGTTQWAYSVESASHSSAFSGIAYHSDKLYVTGYIENSDAITIGNNQSFTGDMTQKNGLLIQYNTSGEAQWVAGSLSGVTFVDLLDVAVSSTGKIYVTGQCNGSGAFTFSGGFEISPPFLGSNAVVLVFTNTGSAESALFPSSSNANTIFNGVTASADYIWAAGSLFDTNPVDFGNSIRLEGVDNAKNSLLIQYSP